MYHSGKLNMELSKRIMKFCRWDDDYCSYVACWWRQCGLVCIQEENKKKQTHNEMMFGSHPAAAVARKRHADPAALMSPRTAFQPKLASISWWVHILLPFFQLAMLNNNRKIDCSQLIMEFQYERHWSQQWSGSCMWLGDCINVAVV